jgi:hypothetical protein
MVMAKTTRRVRWVEYDRLESGSGHGVEFLYSENEQEFVVAFLEGFDWRNGRPATVSLAKARPTLIAEKSWSEIIAIARQAVGVFLSDESNLDRSLGVLHYEDSNPDHLFRHGPIHIWING